MKNTINGNSIAEIKFTLNWSADDVNFIDILHGTVNFWRDILPESIKASLGSAFPDETVEIRVDPGVTHEPEDQAKIHLISKNRFDGKNKDGAPMIPRRGRFYPKGMLKDFPNIFRANINPFRMGVVNGKSLEADLNHPFSSKSGKLAAKIKSIKPKIADKGGTAHDWMERILDGPGMQARKNSMATDFFSETLFTRSDETPDEMFYEKPRFVNHLDEVALQTVRDIYGGLLKPETKVLDLMASHVSHIPSHITPLDLTVLGMNEEELMKNPLKSRYNIWDLNQNPHPPFDGETFDAVVCTVSVEYLVDPLTVFRSVHDVLKPGGIFIVTFSNRWFESKVVHLWKELHEFERLGFVLECFHETGGFTGLHAFSERGLPRPVTDKYFPGLMYSDPVYAVWGTKKTP